MTKSKNKKSNRNHTTKSRQLIIRHHVKRVFHATPKFVHGMIAGAFIGVMIVGVLRTNGIASASTSPAVSDSDCSPIAVIYCGATSVSQLISKYNNGDNDPYGNASKIYIMHDIYNWFGITPADINAMASDTVTGYVTKGGDVYTGDPQSSNKLVATNALTGGRTNPYGNASTPETYGATHFFVRPPSVSFLDQNLKAFVVMKNGVFQYAILYSCGNPIKATAVQPPKPTPTPTPTPTPKPTPKPALVCNELDLLNAKIESNGDWSYTLEGKATPTNGAKISSYDFNFGDKSTDAIIHTSATDTSVAHSYPPGTYTATVTVNGTNSLVSSCQRSFTINTSTTPPIVTPAPTTPTPVQVETTATSLPNTGPGAVIIIAIASVAGGYVFHMGHRHIRNKRRTTHHTTHRGGPTHHHPAHAH